MLYLDTANISELKRAFSSTILSGVTTNPTILLKENRKREESINEILACTSGIVFVQTVGENQDEIYHDALKILEFNTSRIALKVPAHLEGIEVIKKIKDEYPQVKILATAIFSVDQAILAALAKSDFIAPYINRMENNNIDPYEVIKRTRKIYDDQGLETKILGASFKNTNQLINTFYAGAHTATISYDLYTNMANKDLALLSIKKFNEDAYKLL
jgi:TalC/MipB family fructose-6-phosphate aldolase